MSVKPEEGFTDIKIAGFTDIKIANVFINLIYLIIFHPTPLVTLIKWNIVFVSEVLVQPGSETRIHNIETICELCHANVDKQSKLLVDVEVTPPRGAVYITWHFNVLH